MILSDENLEDLVKEFPISMSNPYCGAGCGIGWKPLIRKVLLVLEKHKARVAQIKEKFGGLIIYIDPPISKEDNWNDHGFKECYNAIRQSEEESFKVCEECGAEGKLRSGGWLKTLCENHSSK